MTVNDEEVKEFSLNLPFEAAVHIKEAASKTRRVPVPSMLGSSILAFLLATYGPCDLTNQQSNADVSFHRWCETVGIETPLARLETTERSVAGRGIFAVQDIRQGDVVISIPESIAFHEYNAASAFPKLASKLWKQKQRYQDFEDGRSRWWHHLSIPRRKLARRNFDFIASSDLWQATLTSFGLESLETNHPWSDWITQWKRSDPMQTLFESGVTWRDEDEVLACVDEFEELKTVFNLKDVNASKMFGVLTSRAMELGDGVLGPPCL